MSRLPRSHRLHRLLPMLATGMVASAIALSGAASADDATANDPIILKVNGKSFHRSYIALLLQELQQSNQNQNLSLDDPQVYAALQNRLAVGELMTEAAEKDKLDKDAQLKEHLAFVRSSMLQNLYAQELGKAAATSNAEHALYDQHVVDHTLPPEVHARHIVVATEDEAKDIIAQLDKGADFATLAHQKSLDTSSDGGDLPWFTPDGVPHEFADALFKMKKGDHSETPIQNEIGFHIFEIVDTRPASFADLKGQLDTQIARGAIQKKLAQLQASAKITKYSLDGKPVPQQ